MKTKTILTLMTLLAVAGCTSANKTTDKPQTTDNMDTFKTKSGKEITFTPIKHASMAITFGNTEIQVDPVIDAQPPHTDYTKFPKAALSKESTVIVTNKNSAEILGKGKVMANGDSLKLADDIMVYAVPAYNTTEGHLQFHPKGRDNGFILVLDGTRIYIAGDTEDIEEMKDVKDIDIAFLPCNQPYTMTPEQLRKAADMVKPRVLYPYHFGDTDREAMKAALDGTGIDVRIRNFE